MVLYTPLTLILVLLWNKVFYLLFNYRISSYLRPYSFWLIVADILIQNNIEFFTFLGLRSLDTMFSFNFSTKALNAFSIIFIFIIISCVAYSYLLYYYKYGKLARYFLVNMFRFRSSYVLMIITYGVRPFLKGVIHAMFFEEWELQLWLLTGI